MKKEFKKKYKAHFSRFTLLVIFNLIIVYGVLAQCDAVTPGGCTTCVNEINIQNSCMSCYGTGSLTDLKNTGVGPTGTFTIHATGFASVTSVTLTNITLFDVAVCNGVSGGSFANSAAFNAAMFGITITEGKDQVTVAISPTVNAALVGMRLNFIANVFNGDNLLTSRNYVTKIVSTSIIVGDTHITTVDGVKYDFQAVGEFVALRGEGGNNLEIQTRQTAVATQGPGHDSYDDLTTCVALNTAVAARVGSSRVTYQPKIDGHPDSTGMELRVDGNLTQLDNNGLNLPSGGRITKSSAGGGAIEIDFPDGTSLVVTPTWWSSYNVWYLNVSINNTSAKSGISGAIAYNDTAHGIFHRSRSWLPALPDGSSVGPMPQSSHDRFVTLYQTFANAWRVTDATSLFDYASGKSTASYTDKNWPVEGGLSCVVPGETPKPPIGLAQAQQLTIGIINPTLKANAIYDVMLTGDPIFAQTYLATDKAQSSTTGISVYGSKDTTKYGDSATFTATVVRKFSGGTAVLAGNVEFTADGKSLGQVKLEANGLAALTTATLEVGQHQIAAKFTPDAGSTAFSSTSLAISHVVTGAGGIAGILHQWWFWALLVLLLIILFFAMRKKKP